MVTNIDDFLKKYGASPTQTVSEDTSESTVKSIDDFLKKYAPARS